MMNWLSRKLSSFFIKSDPKANAFNSFYRELAQSETFYKISNEHQGHPHPCYNLCDEDSYIFLSSWLKDLKKSGEDQSFLEWGCGHAPLLSLGDFKSGSYTGIDFSQVALSYAKKKFPNQNFILHHQNFKLPLKQKFKRVLAIDSLYGNQTRNDSHKRPKNLQSSREALKKPFSRALNLVEEELLIYQNIFGPVTDNIENLLPQFQGWSVSYENKTLDFHSLVASWHQALQRPEVVEDREKYPLLWGTISQEMNQHQKSLRKKGENDESNLYRLFIRYKKII